MTTAPQNLKSLAKRFGTFLWNYKSSYYMCQFLSPAKQWRVFYNAADFFRFCCILNINYYS